MLVVMRLVMAAVRPLQLLVQTHILVLMPVQHHLPHKDCHHHVPHTHI